MKQNSTGTAGLYFIKSSLIGLLRINCSNHDQNIKLGINHPQVIKIKLRKGATIVEEEMTSSLTKNGPTVTDKSMYLNVL